MCNSFEDMVDFVKVPMLKHRVLFRKGHILTDNLGLIMEPSPNSRYYMYQRHFHIYVAQIYTEHFDILICLESFLASQCNHGYIRVQERTFCLTDKSIFCFSRVGRPFDI